MAKSKLKTLKNKASVVGFIAKVKDTEQREDSRTLLRLYKKVTKQKPVMWGTSIIGFGVYHYKSERSAQEGDWPRAGFSPRKGTLTIYIMPGFSAYKKYLKKLGKHKTSVGCLYIKKLSDVNLSVLEKLIALGYRDMEKRYPTR